MSPQGASTGRGANPGVSLAQPQLQHHPLGEQGHQRWPGRCGPPGQGVGMVRWGRGAHIMVHRFLRRAPWKRMVVWTCLQRAQPTLLRSSLKSRRMCQLYLAEHSM